jgi:hypothetical protein
MVILVTVALLATVGGAGCGNETTAPVDTSQDTAAPAVVTGLGFQLSTTENPNIMLMWNAGAEPDLMGYNVYRARLDGAEPQSKRSAGRIATEMRLLATVTQEFYLDDGVLSGETYRYAVSAVDESGNESGWVYTEPVRVEVDERLPRDQVELKRLK